MLSLFSKLIRGWSLQTRILFVGLLGIVAAILVASMMMWSEQKLVAGQREVVEIGRISEQLRMLEAALERARADERDFALTRQNDRAVKARAAIFTAQDQATKLAATARSSIAVELAKLEEIMTKQVADFDAAARLQVEVGAGRDAGMKGDWAATGQKIEALLRRFAGTSDSAQAYRMLASAAALRTSETAFIIDQDVTAEGYITSEQDRLRRLSQRAPDFAELKDELGALVDEHERRFLDLKRVQADLTAIYHRFEASFINNGVLIGEALTRLTGERDDIVASVAEAQRQQQMVTLSALGLILAGALILAIGVARNLSRRLATLQGAMARLSAGETDLAIPGTENSDDIGIMARAVEVFRKTAIENKALGESTLLDVSERAERGKRVQQIVETFHDDLGNVLGQVNDAVSRMNHVAVGLRDASASANRRSTEAGRSAEATAGTAAAVAGAADKIAESVRQISAQTSRSTEIARTAEAESQRSIEAAATMTQATARVTDMVKLVDHIAQQTNLLALNATIEAARAGEAGRGFAVVAGEVKSLASQTAKTTEEIARLVGSIEAAGQTTSDVARELHSVIVQMRESSTVIAGAMDEQDQVIRAVSGDISELLGNASNGSNSAAAATQAALTVDGIANQVDQLAGLLTSEARRLEQTSRSFADKLSAA